jgi:hypothetical protein
VQRGIERRNRLRFGPFDLAPLDLEGPNPIEVARGAYRGARRFAQDPRNAPLYDPTTAERYDPRRVFQDEPYSVPEVVVTAPRPSLGRRAHAFGEDALSAVRAAPGAIVDYARAPFRQFEADSRQLDRARFRGNDGAASDAALGAFSSGALAASEFLPGGVAFDAAIRGGRAAVRGGKTATRSMAQRGAIAPLTAAGTGAGAFALPTDEADAQARDPVTGDPVGPVPSRLGRAQGGYWVDGGRDIDGDEWGLPKGPRYRIETLRLDDTVYELLMAHNGSDRKTIGVVSETPATTEEDSGQDGVGQADPRYSHRMIPGEAGEPNEALRGGVTAASVLAAMGGGRYGRRFGRPRGRENLYAATGGAVAGGTVGAVGGMLTEEPDIIDSAGLGAFGGAGVGVLTNQALARAPAIRNAAQNASQYIPRLPIARNAVDDEVRRSMQRPPYRPARSTSDRRRRGEDIQANLAEGRHPLEPRVPVRTERALQATAEKAVSSLSAADLQRALEAVGRPIPPPPPQIRQLRGRQLNRSAISAQAAAYKNQLAQQLAFDLAHSPERVRAQLSDIGIHLP